MAKKGLDAYSNFKILIFMYNLETIFQLIDQNNVISFDVFDTVLLRPFVIPSDLFDYIEYKYNIKGFSKARKNVVVNSVKEKSIEDIYNNMPEQYSKFMSIELDEEKKLIYPNKKIKTIYQYAIEKKKTIIFTSDIYFHTEYLSEILGLNGFGNYEKIYSSCDYQKTKCSGELFGQILDDYNICANQVVHIGDNIVSDNAVPKALGINSIFIESNCDQYFNYRDYLKDVKLSFWDSFIVKVCADKFAYNLAEENEENRCWYRFGYEVAGPICWCFAKWIKSKIDSERSDISDLAFIARDGYLIKKMFDKLNSNKTIKSHYIFAPRILATLLQESYSFSKNNQKLLQNETNTINEVYGIDNYTKEERQKFVLCLIEKFKNYLQNFGFGNGVIAVVDSTTNNLSSQKLLEQFSNNKTCGMYWFASQYAYSLNYDILTCQDERYVVVESEDLFELIFKSPEPTIKRFCLDGTFEFNKLNESEERRIKNFAFIEKGAMEFFEDVEIHGLCGFPNASIINIYLERYCENPNKEERHIIEQGLCSGGIANTIWEPTKVFIDKRSRRSPIEIKKRLKRAIVKHPKLFILIRKLVHIFK